jgi:hypothetical protein
MALTKREAEERAAAVLRIARDPGSDSAIVAAKTTRAPFGWICFYESRKFLETGESRYALAGNGPIVVNGRDGTAVMLSPLVSLADQVREYEREWGRVHDATA